MKSHTKNMLGLFGVFAAVVAVKRRQNGSGFIWEKPLAGHMTLEDSFNAYKQRESLGYFDPTHANYDADMESDLDAWFKETVDVTDPNFGSDSYPFTTGAHDTKWDNWWSTEGEPKYKELEQEASRYRMAPGFTGPSSTTSGFGATLAPGAKVPVMAQSKLNGSPSSSFFGMSRPKLK